MMTKIKAINYAAYIILGAAFLTILLIGYWAISGRDALHVSNAPVPVTPKVVKSGDYITLTVDFCKHTDVSGRLIQRLSSDQAEIFAPTRVEPSPAGCYEDMPVRVPIPPQTTPDTYVVSYRITYKTNPLHTVVEEFKSEAFEVIE